MGLWKLLSDNCQQDYKSLSIRLDYMVLLPESIDCVLKNENILYDNMPRSRMGVRHGAALKINILYELEKIDYVA
jgi:hypothetical protein